MMGSTMLQLVQAVTGELGLNVPTFVAGNPAQDAQQILALMNAVGVETVPKFEWQALYRTYRFYTQFVNLSCNIVSGSPSIVTGGEVALITDPTQWMPVGNGIPQDTFFVSSNGSGTYLLDQLCTATGNGVPVTASQVRYALPTDYDHPVNRTQWDKSKHWEMLGPETPQQWEWLKSGYIATGPRIRWRIIGNQFEIWPAIGVSDYLGFEYISRSWAYSSANVAQTSLVADTDTSIFSDRLMIIGTKLKYFEVKNFDTTALLQDFQTELNLRKAIEQGAPTLSFAPRLSQVLIDITSVPDSGYGSPN